MSDEIKKTSITDEKKDKTITAKNKILIDVLDKGLLNLKEVGALANTLHIGADSSDGKCGCRDECPCHSKCVSCGSTISHDDISNPNPTEYRSEEILNAIKKALGNK